MIATARGRGQGKHNNRFEAGRPGCCVAIGTDDELLPQPLGMLSRELSREGVQATHALDGDQERLILPQPRLDEHTHLIAQMRFELLDVGSGDGATPAQVGAALADLLFERRMLGP